MNKAEYRLECLKLAQVVTRNFREVLATADAYLDYVMKEGDPTEDVEIKVPSNKKATTVKPAA